MPSETANQVAAQPEPDVPKANTSKLGGPEPDALPKLDPDEQEAMEYVRDIKGFYNHALQYGLVMAGLTLINLFTSPGYFWVIWPALGWGIGLAMHGLSVFEVVNLFGDDWEKRQIARRLKRK